MATAIQPIPGVADIGIRPTVESLLPLLPKAAATPSAFSVIVTLNAASPVSLTYDSDGLFQSLLQVVTTPAGGVTTAAASDTANDVVDVADVLPGTTAERARRALRALLLTNATLTAAANEARIAAKAAVAAADVVAATVAGSVPAAGGTTPAGVVAEASPIADPTAATAASSAVVPAPEVLATALPREVVGLDSVAAAQIFSRLVDAAIQARTTITGNPAYASAAAALYAHAAIFRAQQAATLASGDIPSALLPLASVTGIRAI